MEGLTLFSPNITANMLSDLLGTIQKGTQYLTPDMMDEGVSEASAPPVEANQEETMDVDAESTLPLPAENDLSTRKIILPGKTLPFGATVTTQRPLHTVALIADLKREHESEPKDMIPEDNPQMSFHVPTLSTYEPTEEELMADLDAEEARESAMVKEAERSITASSATPKYATLDTEQLVEERAHWQSTMLKDIYEIKEQKRRLAEEERKLSEVSEKKLNLQRENVFLRFEAERYAQKYEREHNKSAYDLGEAEKKVGELQQKLEHCNRCNIKYSQVNRQLGEENHSLKNANRELQDRNLKLEGFQRNADTRRGRAEHQYRDELDKTKILEQQVKNIQQALDDANTLNAQQSQSGSQLQSQVSAFTAGFQKLHEFALDLLEKTEAEKSEEMRNLENAHDKTTVVQNTLSGLLNLASGKYDVKKQEAEEFERRIKMIEADLKTKENALDTANRLLATEQNERRTGAAELERAARLEGLYLNEQQARSTDTATVQRLQQELATEQQGRGEDAAELRRLVIIEAQFSGAQSTRDTDAATIERLGKQLKDEQDARDVDAAEIDRLRTAGQRDIKTEKDGRAADAEKFGKSLQEQKAATENAEKKLEEEISAKATVEKNLRELQEKRTAVDGDLERLQEEKLTLEKDLDEEKAARNTADRDVKRLKKERLTLEENLDAMKTVKDTANSKVETLQAAKLSLEKDVRDEKGAKIAVIDEFDAFKAASANLAKRLASDKLNRELLEILNEIALDTSRKEVLRLREEIIQLCKELSKVAAKNVALVSKHNAAEARHKGSTKEIRKAYASCIRFPQAMKKRLAGQNSEVPWASFVDAFPKTPVNGKAKKQEAKIARLEQETCALTYQLETKKSDLAAAIVNSEKLAQVIDTQIEEKKSAVDNITKEKNAVVDNLNKENKNLAAELLKEKRLRIQIQLAGSNASRGRDYQWGNIEQVQQRMDQLAGNATKKKHQRGPRPSELKKAAKAKVEQELAEKEIMSKTVEAERDTESITTQQRLNPVQYLFRSAAALGTAMRYIL